ncbi:MAG: hypothetical protein MUF54_16455 [Polyangiaceae bacterium]|nr:hypothetical protein [Polyangiaceae bacterium]
MDDVLKVSTALADIFTPYERGRIGVFRDFLAEFISPDIAPRAAGVGYDVAEHQEAWRQMDIVEGRELTLDDALGVAQRTVVLEASPTVKVHLRFLDQEEDRWFDRYRKAIPRFITREHLADFETAFWQDNSQQPEGPGVLDSMTKLCDRHVALATNDTPGAKDLHAAMDRRGFNAVLIADVRQRIKQCRVEMPVQPAPLVDEARLLEIARKRREAYEWLNNFFIDWATTLRTELTYHQAVRLGITQVKGGRRPTEKPPEPLNPETR